MATERVAQCSVVGVDGCRARHHHEVDTGDGHLVMSESFPNEAFEPVSVDGSAYMSFSDREAEPGILLPSANRQHGKERVGRSHRVGKDLPEIGGVEQARRSSQALIRNVFGPVAGQAQGMRRWRPLARRAFSTLRPPRVAMRARKPWVRARLIRLGWKVRFMTVVPTFTYKV